MIDKNEATTIAEEYLKTIPSIGDVELALMPEHTREFEKGWVFFYQSRRFVETGDMMEMVGGNAPLIVDKMDGSVHVTGTGRPIEDYVSEYPWPKKERRKS